MIDNLGFAGVDDLAEQILSERPRPGGGAFDDGSLSEVLDAYDVEQARHAAALLDDEEETAIIGVVPGGLVSEAYTEVAQPEQLPEPAPIPRRARPQEPSRPVRPPESRVVRRAVVSARPRRVEVAPRLETTPPERARRRWRRALLIVGLCVLAMLTGLVLAWSTGVP